MPCFLIQKAASSALLNGRVLAEDRVADVVVRGLERDPRVHAAGLGELLDVVLARHVRHQDDVERDADLLLVAIAELVEPLARQVEDVVHEVDELQVVALLDLLQLGDDVIDRALAHVLGVRRPDDLLLERVVEAERAVHRAAALRDEHLPVALLVDGARLVDDLAVGEPEAVEVRDGRTLRVLVDLAGLAVPDPQVLHELVVRPVRDVVQELGDRDLPLAAADRVDVGVLLDHLGREGRVRSAEDDEHVRQLLLDPLRDVEAVPRIPVVTEKQTTSGACSWSFSIQSLSGKERQDRSGGQRP